MPYTTLKTRAKTGTADDASPNTVAPTALEIVEIPTTDRAVNAPARGWTYFLDFLTAAGAPVTDGVADVTPWVRDELDGIWVECDTDESVGHRELMQTDPAFAGAAFFFQLSSIEGTDVATVRVRVGSF